MKALKFNLYGKYGFFKNHEANKTFMTYQYIPKTTLMGLMGAIIGLDGWKQMSNNEGKLEFYEVFKNSKISITPNKPYFNTFYETINNSTGFVNKDGTTANITKQILQDPSYMIMIQKDGIEEKYYNKLKEMLTKGESIYKLSLGGSRYIANISDFEEIELKKCIDREELIVNSLIKLEHIYTIYSESEDGVQSFQSNLYYPTNYNVNGNYGHLKEEVCFSNHYIDIKDGCELFRYKNALYNFI